MKIVDKTNICFWYIFIFLIIKLFHKVEKINEIKNNN